MECNSLNLTIRQSTLFSRTLKIEDNAGNLIDLTGYAFNSIAVLAYGQAAASFTFVFAIQNQVTNKGEVLWTLPGARTSGLNLKEDTVYLYDVLMVQPSFEPVAIISGQIIILPVITPI